MAELGRQHPLWVGNEPRFGRGGDGKHAQQTHLAGLLPEDLGNRNKGEVLELLRTPLRVPGLVLKVQLLSQSLLQVLQQANEIRSSDPNHPKPPSIKALLTFRTHRNPKLGCINLTMSRRISKVLMSPSNRSLRSMYCTCGDQRQLLGKLPHIQQVRLLLSSGLKFSIYETNKWVRRHRIF